MELFIVILSIFIITGVVFLFNRLSLLKVCPICAGVLGTWLWMLAGMVFGYLPTTNYQLPISILMGGSVVGIAYQAEKHFLRKSENALLWKAIFIPFGFATVFMIVNFFCLRALIGILILKLTALVFLDWKQATSDKKQEISDKRQVISETRKKKLEKEM